MSTLLEIYDSFANGQKDQFIAQVKEYGHSEFASDMELEIAEGILSFEEAYKMLRCVLMRGDLI